MLQPGIELSMHLWQIAHWPYLGAQAPGAVSFAAALSLCCVHPKMWVRPSVLGQNCRGIACRHCSKGGGRG